MLRLRFFSEYSEMRLLDTVKPAYVQQVSNVQLKAYFIYYNITAVLLWHEAMRPQLTYITPMSVMFN